MTDREANIFLDMLDSRHIRGFTDNDIRISNITEGVYNVKVVESGVDPTLNLSMLDAVFGSVVEITKCTVNRGQLSFIVDFR